MTRESVYSKARRYLVEGRVLIRYVDTTTVVAHVRGSDAVYRVVGTADGRAAASPAAAAATRSPSHS